MAQQERDGLSSEELERRLNPATVLRGGLTDGQPEGYMSPDILAELEAAEDRVDQPDPDNDDDPENETDEERQAREAEEAAETDEEREAREAEEAEAAERNGNRRTGRNQRRINDLIAGRTRAERERDRIAAENETLRRQNEMLVNKVAGKPSGDEPPPEGDDAPPVDVGARPKAEDFDDQDKFLDAFMTWSQKAARATARAEVQAASKKSKGEQRKADLEAEQREADAAFEKRLETARKDIPDFDEVLEQNTIDVPTNVVEALKRVEKGPELMYHFSKHPEELREIMAIRSQGSMIYELGQKAAVLGSARKASASRRGSRRRQNATRVTPLGGGSSTSGTDRNYGGMDLDTYRAQRESGKLR